MRIKILFGVLLATLLLTRAGPAPAAIDRTLPVVPSDQAILADIVVHIHAVQAAEIHLFLLEAERQELAAYQAELDRQRATAAVQARSSPPPSSAGGGGGADPNSVRAFLECTIDHESRTAGVYSAVSPSGTYRGAYQFDQPTWNGAVDRAGYGEWSGSPADQAPPHVQDAAAAQLYSERGNQPWGGRC